MSQRAVRLAASTDRPAGRLRRLLPAPRLALAFLVAMLVTLGGTGAVALSLSRLEARRQALLDRTALPASGAIPADLRAGLIDEIARLRTIRHGLWLGGGTLLLSLLAAGLALQRHLERAFAERRAVEADLRRTNRALRTLGATSELLVRAPDEATLLQELCRVVVAEGGYRMAWIGFAENDAGRSVRPVAYSGFEHGYLEQAGITWADTPRGRGPTGTALRTRQPAICRDMLSDPAFVPWREDALHRGYASSIVLPLIADETLLGALNIYAAEPDAFDRDETRLLTELANDLAFGLVAQRTRRQRDLAETTARELAETAVRNERRRLEDVLHRMPNHVVLLTPDHHVAFANRYFEQRFGQSFGRRCHEYLFNRATPCELCRTFDALHTREPVQWEWLGPDGRNYQVQAFPFTDADGSPLILEVGHDITDLKKAGDALRHASNYHRSLIEAAIDPLVTIGPDGRITDVNAATESATGRSRTELISTDFTDYFTDPSQARAGFQQVFRDGFVRDYPLELRHSGGAIISVLYNASVYRDEHGQVIGVFAAARDITERKRANEALMRSEASLKEAQRLAHIGNWELDLVRDVLTWSDEIYRIFEIDRSQFGASYEAFVATIHPDDRAQVDQAYRESVALRHPYDIVHRLQMKDGRIKHVHERCETIYHHDGRPLRSFGTVQDITERFTAEQEILRLNATLEARVQERTAELAAVNRELESFAYSVSHDLRAPLRGIDGFSRILLRDCTAALGPTGGAHLDRIRAATQRMGILIDDLLHLSRTVRSDLRRTSLDLTALATAIAAELHHTEPTRDVTWEIAANLTATGDLTLIRATLENLLGNAWKFTSRRDGARIAIGRTTTPAGPAFFVRDNGAGFDMAYAAKLFSPFQRLHTVTEFPGTGIGLATVQRIIHRHGGEVWAEGAIGAGATFYFTLPAPAPSS